MKPPELRRQEHNFESDPEQSIPVPCMVSPCARRAFADKHQSSGPGAWDVGHGVFGDYYKRHTAHVSFSVCAA
jgi:hypothetical protein